MKVQKGHIDIMSANAGIAELAPLGEIFEAHYDKNSRIQRVGGLGVYNATKAAVRSFART